MLFVTSLLLWSIDDPVLSEAEPRDLGLYWDPPMPTVWGIILRMLIFILPVIFASIHVYIFYVESIAWGKPATNNKTSPTIGTRHSTHRSDIWI